MTLPEITFANVLDYIGTLAFAISGIRLASTKNFDWFGAYVVGLATAIGGGTVRDLMLDVPVFWMRNLFSHHAACAFACCFVRKSRGATEIHVVYLRYHRAGHVCRDWN